MMNKIVAPSIVAGDSIELDLPFRTADVETTKQVFQAFRDSSPGGSSSSEHPRVPSPRIGLPREHLNCWDLRLLENDPVLDARVKALLPEWDLQLVEIPTSFRPGDGTRIAFGALAVSLESSEEPGPRVFRIIPEQVTSETKERTEFGLDPSLEVKDIAKVSLGRWIRTVEIQNLKPRVTGFWQEHSATWELAAESAEGVLGTKVFYVLVQQRKGVEHCTVALKVKARVETRFGLFITRYGDYTYEVSVKDVF
jgi:hypothetical protein